MFGCASLLARPPGHATNPGVCVCPHCIWHLNLVPLPPLPLPACPGSPVPPDLAYLRELYSAVVYILAAIYSTCLRPAVTAAAHDGLSGSEAQLPHPRPLALKQAVSDVLMAQGS